MQLALVSWQRMNGSGRKPAARTSFDPATATHSLAVAVAVGARGAAMRTGAGQQI
jgi:hypothetical protein